MGATMKYPQVWNLESIYEGGSHSEAFQKSRTALDKKLKTLEHLIKNEDLDEAIALFQTVGKTLREMGTFIHCLQAQDVHDTQANVLLGELQILDTHHSNLFAFFDALLLKLSDKDFDSLLKRHPTLVFVLKERRSRAKDKLPPEKESIINRLSMDGYHGWSEAWDTLIGEMTFLFQDKPLYFGQIENKLSDPDSTVREEAFNTIEEEFSKRKNTFAQLLNHIGGFRLQVYSMRGWSDYLKEPLETNRQSQASLTAMWEAIQNNQKQWSRFLKCKSDLLGLKSLSWFDLDAPLSSIAKTITYDEAADVVQEQFGSFSPKMAAFAKRVLKEGWVEAEDRPGKAPGGFCCALPKIEESRIFMTFSNTITNLYTLAHELGHAYHNEVTFPLEEMNHHSTMGLAETASTMAEMIVTQAMIEKEEDPKQRLLFLDDHLTRAMSYFLNIHARFLFEIRFYEMRQKGAVSAEVLCKLMEEAQREAYGGALERVHPLFWAAKIHYYCTEVPFYNFPYTFGYLFSLGIYSHAKKHADFEDSYISLLQDTGRMTPEALAKKYLGADLSGPSFWQQGIDIIHKDIDTFIELSQKVSL